MFHARKLSRGLIAGIVAFRVASQKHVSTELSRTALVEFRPTSPNQFHMPETTQTKVSMLRFWLLRISYRRGQGCCLSFCPWRRKSVFNCAFKNSPSFVQVCYSTNQFHMPETMRTKSLMMNFLTISTL